MKNWIKSALLGAFIVCVTAACAYGYYVGEQWKYGHRPQKIAIINNEGGYLDEFLTNYANSRRRGDTYKIDGFCVSACTFILGLIPNERVCITPYAVMGFHAARDIDDKDVRRFSVDGTAQMWMLYPEKVKALLRKRGWSGPEKDQPVIIWVGFDELKTIYRVCAPKE